VHLPHALFAKLDIIQVLLPLLVSLVQKVKPTMQQKVRHALRAILVFTSQVQVLEIVSPAHRIHFLLLGPQHAHHALNVVVTIIELDYALQHRMLNALHVINVQIMKNMKQLRVL
jgi:hypothetical protein